MSALIPIEVRVVGIDDLPNEKLERAHPAYLYVVDFGHITKVGISLRPKSRLRVLRGASGRPISRIGLAGPFHEARKIEAGVLAAFSQVRVDGSEYMSATFEEVASYLSSLSAPCPSTAVKLFGEGKDARAAASREAARDMVRYFSSASSGAGR